jgi:hypothetical protein
MPDMKVEKNQYPSWPPTGTYIEIWQFELFFLLKFGESGPFFP